MLSVQDTSANQFVCKLNTRNDTSQNSLALIEPLAPPISPQSDSSKFPHSAPRNKSLIKLREYKSHVHTQHPSPALSIGMKSNFLTHMGYHIPVSLFDSVLSSINLNISQAAFDSLNSQNPTKLGLERSHWQSPVLINDSLNNRVSYPSTIPLTPIQTEQCSSLASKNPLNTYFDHQFQPKLPTPLPTPVLPASPIGSTSCASASHPQYNIAQDTLEFKVAPELQQFIRCNVTQYSPITLTPLPTNGLPKIDSSLEYNFPSPIKSPQFPQIARRKNDMGVLQSSENSYFASLRQSGLSKLLHGDEVTFGINPKNDNKSSHSLNHSIETSHYTLNAVATPESDEYIPPSMKAYECNICQKTFTRKSNYANHLRKHASSKKQPTGRVSHARAVAEAVALGLPKPRFPCKFCRRTYSRSDALQRHVRTKMCNGNNPVPAQKIGSRRIQK